MLPMQSNGSNSREEGSYGFKRFDRNERKGTSGL